jgi:hypothetical protein
MEKRIFGALLSHLMSWFDNTKTRRSALSGGLIALVFSLAPTPD